MGEKILELTPAQKFIAKKMRETVATFPQAVTCFDVDMGPMMDLKDKMKEDGKKVTVAAFLIKALAVAIKMNPKMNSRLVGDKIHLYDEVNVGMAMAIENGLIVPVVRDADKKTVEEISNEIKQFKDKQETGKLSIDDMQGATCAITSLGSGNNDIVLPILNYDVTLMLGAGSTKAKPVVLQDGSIGVKNIANCSCTTDHCVMYGAEVGKFCTDFANVIEHIDNYII